MVTKNYFIKTNRIFNPVKKYSWIFILLVAFGGLWYPKLGLLMLPIMLALPVIGMIKGKFWCGNICPQGSVFDQFIMPWSKNHHIPKWATSKITISLAFLWFMGMLSKRMVAVFALWGATPFWDKLGYIFVFNYLMVTVIGTILSLTISPRTWCRFCPMGTVQILFYKLGKWLGINKNTDKKVTIKDSAFCHKCGKCARVCPVQIEPYQEFSSENQLENENCIRCQTCVQNCPANILSMHNKKTAAIIKGTLDLTGYLDRQTLIAKINDIEELGNDIKTFSFELPTPLKNYQSGQFVLIKIQDIPLMYRAYSIAGYQNQILKVTVKKVPAGYGTNILFEDFKKGDLVTLEGPLGHELVVDPAAQNILLVAGGIGITPFVPIVEDLLKRQNVQNIKLAYGVNKASDLIYNDFFSQIADARFEFLPVVLDDDNWQGAQGYVTDVINKLTLDDYQVYMCGPKPMADATSKLLKEKNLSKDQINIETA